MSNKEKKEKKFSRYSVFYMIMSFVFLAIVTRLVYLQVVKGEEFKEKSNQNNYKNVSKMSPRGDIIDRNGKILATSKPSFGLVFTETKESKEKFFETMDKVLEVLDENKNTLQDDFPIKIKHDTNKNVVEYFFAFKGINEASKRFLELRFKKDRGYDEILMKQKYGTDMKKEQLTKEQEKEIDKEVMRITPEEVFQELFEQYGLEKLYGKDSTVDKLLAEKKIDLDKARKYILVKDTLKMKGHSGYKPVVIASDLKQKTAFIFEQKQPDLPGISVITQPVREYPNNELGSAFLGYLSKINSDKKDKYEEKGYDVSSDLIGVAGLEAAFESVLKGTKGQESIQVNKSGRKIKTLGEVEPYPGQTLKLNVDANIQYAAERAIDDAMATLQKQGRVKDVDTTNATRGAVVAIDVRNGKILALASRPGYDPNLFTIPGKLTDELNEKYFYPKYEKNGREYIKRMNLADVEGVFSESQISNIPKAKREEQLLNILFPKKNDEREDFYDIFPKPILNYATSSLIPPGSIFKPLTSIAGLQEGVIGENDTVYDNGYYNKRYKDVKRACWIFNNDGGSHGYVDVRKALEVSCNYYFYEVADRLYAKGNGTPKTGLDLLAKYAWKYGLGIDHSGTKEASTGIEIPENFGQVYNYTSSQNRMSSDNIDKLTKLLKLGTNTFKTVRYKPIDISVNTNKDVKENSISDEKKQKLINSIKEEMKKDKKSNSASINKNMVKLLNDIISSSAELKQKNYTSNDISAMAATIEAKIVDARTEILTATNLYDAAIGQGMNQFTPLQLCNYIATLVNGGTRYELHLVDKFLDAEGKVIKANEPKTLEKVSVNPQFINIIKEGMLQVTSDPDGTAYKVFKGFPIQTGGKTGSGTFSPIQSALGRTSYGWYVGFAPYDNPQIAVCAVVFDGGHGAYVAPAAKAIFEQYFRKDLLKINPQYPFMYDLDTKKSNVNFDDIEITGHD